MRRPEVSDPPESRACVTASRVVGGSPERGPSFAGNGFSCLGFRRRLVHPARNPSRKLILVVPSRTGQAPLGIPQVGFVQKHAATEAQILVRRRAPISILNPERPALQTSDRWSRTPRPTEHGLQAHPNHSLQAHPEHEGSQLSGNFIFSRRRPLQGQARHDSRRRSFSLCSCRRALSTWRPRPCG